MTFELVFLDAVDPSLGRVDHESLPQHALMEMVIEGITNKEEICVDVDEPKDIEEWKGVTIEDGQVIEIDWNGFKLSGSLHLQWLPSSVRKLVVPWNNLMGTLDLASLPTAMENLFLGFNAFTGSIGLERLPKRMKYLDVSYNQLSGSLKLDSLPDTLTDFCAIANQFSGSVDLTKLPAA
ncbi:hypothetical protein XU18_3053, partial [Perkinsela sp. CCAP 1560/4]